MHRDMQLKMAIAKSENNIFNALISKCIMIGCMQQHYFCIKFKSIITTNWEILNITIVQERTDVR